MKTITFPPLTILLKLLFVVLVVIGFTGCQKENENENLPEVSIRLGVITDTSVEVILDLKNSEKSSCLLVEDTEGASVPDANYIFAHGTPAETPNTVSLVLDAKPETDYIIYAASAKDDKFSKVSNIEVTTLPASKMLSFISSDKTSFTYKVEVKPDVTYRHCYMEGWYFEYALAQNKETEGDEFDMKVFLWNLLAQYGYDGAGTQEITWTAGQTDEMRDGIACLAPGKKYYAICSPYNESETYHGTPEAISFSMEPGGKSSSTVTPDVESCTPKEVRIRMNCDESVKFFFYQFYTTTTADKYLAENGEAGMMEHLFEYGWPAANTYTDVWNTDPETEYTLLVYGVDAKGDEFLKSMNVTTPALQPSVNVTIKPYERELDGYHTYDTFEITVETENITSANAEQIQWTLQPKAQLEATLSMMGMTLESLKDNPEYLAYIGAMPLPAEDAEQFNSSGKFIHIFPELEANTEYCYAIIVNNGEKYILGLETAFTDPEPNISDTDPEYLGYLGEWVVTGTSTEDWKTPLSYTIRFEELTPNRSFKVYGWGQDEVSQEFPFVARYNTNTKTISIEPQILGTKIIDGKEYEIRFSGLLSNLQVYQDYTGTIFTGKLSQGHFAMFGEMIKIDGTTYEFTTMAYMAINGGSYYTLPGDPYNNVNFHISRKN